MTDIKAVVYGAALTLINNGVDAYNAAVVANSLPGCPQVSRLLDDRTTGKQQAKLTSAAPNDFAQLRLSHSGGNEQKTQTPTFGLARGAACDAIVPRTVTLNFSIQYDGALIADNAQTPLESYIDAAFHVGYPKMGISYCRGFTFNDTRKPENKDGVQRSTFRRTINVELWPHLAATQ